MLKKIISGFLLVLSISASPVFAQDESSESFITSRTKSILDKVSVSKPEQYRPIIKEELLPLFDWEKISKGTLGKNWSSMTPEQIKEFTQSFQTLLIKTYGTSIEPYKKATFSVVSARKSENLDSVKVILKASGQKNITLDYRITQVNQKYLIQDVIIEGLSFIQVFKTGFNDEISKTSVEAFLKKLATKSNS